MLFRNLFLLFLPELFRRIVYVNSFSFVPNFEVSIILLLFGLSITMHPDLESAYFENPSNPVRKSW